MAPLTTADLERRPGRPRSEHCDQAIRAAVLDLLVEEGFAGMTIEGVAARASVGKATIYRRWPSKEDLVVDAMVTQCRDNIVSPDTGSLREDLLVMLRAMIEKFRRDGRLVMAFNDEQRRHPQLADAFRRTFLDERRAVYREIFERAMARGELPPDADLELLMDVGPALLWHRLAVTGAPVEDDLPERIVNQFLPR
jgi:AcrR family transcriptional regulator